jgi:hypothetical protein
MPASHGITVAASKRFMDREKKGSGLFKRNERTNTGDFGWSSLAWFN